MKKPIIIVGIGEIGGVFARAFLRIGFHVYPIIRGTKTSTLINIIPSPELVLLTVNEGSFHEVLNDIPPTWYNCLVLVQNELLPYHFKHIQDVTVISVWFEKKPGQDLKMILPSPIFGPKSKKIKQALEQGVNMKVYELNSEKELRFALVVKNLYILATNIVGLEINSNVGEAWTNYRIFFEQVASDIIDIQEVLTNTQYNRKLLIQALIKAINADPKHMCMGRNATIRLSRAITHAKDLKLKVPVLYSIAKKHHCL